MSRRIQSDTVAADRLGQAGDDIYALLIDAHEGLSDGESAALNARLVLILANVVADREVIEEGLALARSREFAPRRD